MRRRTGVKKAVVRGATLAGVVVVGLLVLSNSGVPLIPGRPPTTSDPDPVRFQPEGPIASGSLSVRLVDPGPAAHDPSAPAGPQDSATTGERGTLVQISPRGLQTYLDSDDGDPRNGPQPQGSSPDTKGTLAAVLFALIVLKVTRDQDRDRRRRSPTPASAPVPELDDVSSGPSAHRSLA
jgi:hypothetical protein